MENKKKIKENNKSEENDSKNEDNMTYYKTRKEALKHSQAGDKILHDPIMNKYYIIRPWAPIPKDIIISYPPSSPTFSTKNLDKIYIDIFRKKKKKSR